MFSYYCISFGYLGYIYSLRGSEVQGYKGAAFPYLVDKRFDQNPDAQAAVFIAPYKHKVDSIMSPVVGETAHYMAAGRPESELSNLLCDIWYGLVRISKRSLCSPFIIWVVFVQPWLRENKRLEMSMIWLLSRIRYVSLL